MRILVTGAGGMLGSEIAEQLSGSHEVLAHDRNVGDLRDRAQVEPLFDGVDAVVHAAALPSPLSAAEPVVFGNNVDATFHLLDAAGRAGVKRIVYVSSLSALGLAWSSRPVSPLFAPDDRGASVRRRRRVRAVQAGRGVHRGDGEPAVGQRGDQPAVPVPRQRATGSSGSSTDVRRDPGADRASLWGWIDTRDAVRAVIAALTAPVEGHALVNVAAPDTTSLVPTAELMRPRTTRRRGWMARLAGFAVPFSPGAEPRTVGLHGRAPMGVRRLGAHEDRARGSRRLARALRRSRRPTAMPGSCAPSATR